MKHPSFIFNRKHCYWRHYVFGCFPINWIARSVLSCKDPSNKKSITIKQ